LLSTADGRELLGYLVGCAIPSGVSLVASVPGAADSAPPSTLFTCVDGTCTFPGQIGLAPSWLDRPLDATGRGWVSACLLARVNAYGVSEKISLRGDHDALVVSDDEAAAYPIQEGAFYGDVLAGQLVWYACEGNGQRGAITGELSERACARPDPSNPGKTICGFDYAGWCGSRRPACDDGQAGWYDECYSSSEQDGDEFAQVITTYVHP
jgi:hypothetical protein